VIKRLWLASAAGAALLIAAPLVFFAAQDQHASEQVPTAGRFVFAGWDGPDLPVWYQMPDAVTPETPVVFVMHGVKRDADRYRNEWAELARKHGFIVIVPEFSRADFPGARGYNTGYFTEKDGTARPRTQWSFAAIEPLFDDVRQRFGTTATRYSIYGHSAGAQFVHRFVQFMPEARIDQAIAANAGWYTMPDPATEFPYGLDGAPVDDAALTAALGKRLTVLLGTADTDPNAPNLRKTPEAEAQGPHRFARGQRFFEIGKQAAAAKASRFGWQVVTVPDVGHSNGKMAKAAAPLLVAE
jgi:poly(3-hydroxybutyrate) depolymerase